MCVGPISREYMEAREAPPTLLASISQYFWHTYPYVHNIESSMGDFKAFEYLIPVSKIILHVYIFLLCAKVMAESGGQRSGNCAPPASQITWDS